MQIGKGTDTDSLVMYGVLPNFFTKPATSTPTQQDISQSVSEEGSKQKIIAFCNRDDRFFLNIDHHAYDSMFKGLSAKGKIEVLHAIYGNSDQFAHFKGELPKEMRDTYEIILEGCKEKESKKKIEDRTQTIYVPCYENERAAIKQYMQQLT